MSDMIDIQGAIDLHIHSHPCLFPRIADDRTIAQAAAEAVDRVFVAGLGALARDRHRHRQTAARTGFGGHLQGSSAHGGIGMQQASPGV